MRPSGTQEAHRAGGHEHRCTCISQDCRSQARDTDDGGHQEHRLEAKRCPDVLADVAHRGLREGDHADVT